MRLATQLFGGRVNRSFDREAGRQEGPGAAPQPQRLATAAAVDVLEQALSKVESLLGSLEAKISQPAPAEDQTGMASDELDELKQALVDVVDRLEGALDQLDAEAQRLSLIADRLEAPSNGALAAAELPAEPATEYEPEPVAIAPTEPEFQPGAESVDIIIAAVPGFQGLMDAQRGLNDLSAVDGASVQRYQNGEASLGVALRDSVSARAIVEGLQMATGYQVVIEEARPEALRLRLRFVSQPEDGASPGRSGIG